MKERYLVCYDYGMGGRWGYVLALSPEDIQEKFPELTVFEQRPSWMSEEDEARFVEGTEDIDDARPPTILTTILIERRRSGHTVVEVWPSRRSDGTVAVAVRYRATGSRGIEALRSYVDGWAEAHPLAGPVLQNELSTAPRLIEVEPKRFDLVIEAVAGSRHWKDLMVMFATHVPANVGFKVEGFCDLVSGRFRPAEAA